MAGTTTNKNCVTTGWILLAENVTAAWVQMQGVGHVRVHVGAADPGAGSEVGVIIDGTNLSTIPLVGLESGVDQVWGRAMNNAETVAVLTTGG